MISKYENGKFHTVECRYFTNGQAFYDDLHKAGYNVEPEHRYGLYGFTSCVSVYTARKGKEVPYTYIVSFYGERKGNIIAVDTLADLVSLLKELMPIVQASLETYKLQEGANRG
jgi:hypothetical protein